MSRRTLALAAILAVLLVGLAVFLLARDSAELGGGPADQPERRASQAGRASPVATPVAAVGGAGPAQSARGDWWEVAFTDPKYPDLPANHRGGLDQRLVELLDRATTSIDLAIYDFDLDDVAQALARAAQRRVRVRMVTDTDTLENTRDEAIQAAFARVRAAGIPIVDDQRQDIMHDKFVVVDAEWVLTGSWNFTDGDTYHLNNNQFIARSRELAANYTAEFEQMFVQRRFGGSKTTVAPHPRFSIGGTAVENYFAPADHVADRLVEAINRRSRASLYFLAFSFTHDGLGQAMISRARDGATVQGVFETTGSNTPASEFGKLKREGLDVYQDGNPWVMHHKVIIMDEQSVAFGSFNFSANADRGNDENLLIVDDARLAQAFKAEYDRVLTLARNPPVRKR